MKHLWHWLARRRAARLADRLKQHLPMMGCVLDVGSGTGHNALALRTHRGVEVVEVDVADLHVVGDGPILFDGTSLPFSDGQFAVTLLIFVLHYPVDPLHLLNEARRVTSERVLVIQSTYCGRLGLVRLTVREFLLGRFAFWLARLTRFIGRVSCPLHPQRYWTREALLAAGRSAGLTLREVQPESPGQPVLRDAKLARDLYVWEVVATP